MKIHLPTKFIYIINTKLIVCKDTVYKYMYRLSSA